MARYTSSSRTNMSLFSLTGFVCLILQSSTSLAILRGSPGVGTTAAVTSPEQLLLENNHANNKRMLDASPQMSVAETNFAGNRSNRPGHMFDVRANNTKAVRIVAMDVNIDSTFEGIPMEIYVKKGTHQGYQTDAGAWRKIGFPTVKGKGIGQPTHVPVDSFEPIEIQAGETVGIYVTIAGKTWRDYPMVTGRVRRKDDELGNDDLVVVGDGSSNKFFLVYSTPRQWNGALYYEYM